MIKYKYLNQMQLPEKLSCLNTGYIMVKLIKNNSTVQSLLVMLLIALIALTLEVNLNTARAEKPLQETKTLKI